MSINESDPASNGSNESGSTSNPAESPLLSLRKTASGSDTSGADATLRVRGQSIEEDSLYKASSSSGDKPASSGGDAPIQRGSTANTDESFIPAARGSEGSTSDGGSAKSNDDAQPPEQQQRRSSPPTTESSTRRPVTPPRRSLTARIQHTLLIVKPHAFEHLSDIRYRLEKQRFHVVSERCVRFYTGSALEFATLSSEGSSSPLEPSALIQRARGFCDDGTAAVGLHLLKCDAIADLNTLCGDEDPEAARQTDPASLRSLYGVGLSFNGVHCSKTPGNAVKELKFFFPRFRAGALAMHGVDDDSIESHDEFFRHRMRDTLQSGLTELARTKPERDALQVLPRILREKNAMTSGAPGYRIGYRVITPSPVVQ